MARTGRPHIAAPPETFDFEAQLFAINEGRSAKPVSIDDHGRTTYGQFANWLNRLAAGRRAIGLKRNERVPRVMQDTADWPAPPTAQVIL